jgi:transcriptional regulator with XRE-family HTH domain
MQTILGSNIAALRERKNMTLDELAKRCGTSKGYIWEIENKSPQPSVYLARKIARTLGVSTDTLISKPIK